MNHDALAPILSAIEQIGERLPELDNMKTNHGQVSLWLSPNSRPLDCDSCASITRSERLGEAEMLELKRIDDPGDGCFRASRLPQCLARAISPGKRILQRVDA